MPGFAAGQTWCPETCQDCGSADFVSPRPARIADQADYGPLHPARATRARDLPGELTDMTGVQIGGIFKGF